MSKTNNDFKNTFWQLVRITVGCFIFVIVQLDVSIAQRASPDSRYPYISKYNRIPVEYFAQARELTQVLLSPDGKNTFYVFPTGNDLIMQIEPLNDVVEEQHYFSGRIPMHRYGGAYWTSNDRVVVMVYSFLFDFTKLFSRRSGDGYFVTLRRSLIAFDVNSNEVDRLLTIESNNPLTFKHELILNPLVKDKDNMLISYAAEGMDYPEIFKLNVYTGDLEKVVSYQENIVNWITDHNGEVRFGYGSDEGGLVMIRRDPITGDWIKLGDQDLFKDDTFYPINFSFEENSLLVRSAVANGRFAVYDFDLEQGVLKEKLFEHPVVDATSAEFSSGTRKLLSVTYHEDKLQRHYFDSEFEKLMNSINRALPMRNNYLEEMTSDGRYMLIRSDSDVFPGAYYRMDVENKQLDLIGEFNTRLNPEYLSPQKKISYFARDGLEVSAYLTIPKSAKRDTNLPVIVIPHSLVEGRDINTFNFLVQFLASRGYAVFQPNYRGSSGYGFAYQAMGYGEWGRNIQHDITDGVQHLISLGIADDERICISGASFGGYSALVSTFQTPALYKCAAALGPVTDLTAYAKSMKRNYGKIIQERMLGDRKRSEIRKVSPVHNIKKIDVPILLIRGENSYSVTGGSLETLNEAEDFVKKLNKEKKDITYIVVEGDADNFRLIKNRVLYLKELEKFFALHLGAPVENETIKYVKN